MKTLLTIALLAPAIVFAGQTTAPAQTICPSSLQDVTCLTMACGKAKVDAHAGARKECESGEINVASEGIYGIPYILRAANLARCSYRIDYGCQHKIRLDRSANIEH